MNKVKYSETKNTYLLWAISRPKFNTSNNKMKKIDNRKLGIISLNKK
jgi:hypothetical protein